MADNIHALPNAIIPSQQITPNPEVVEICEDLLQLAREGSIQSIAHAYVLHSGEVITGWRLSQHQAVNMASAIHRLAWKWEAAVEEGPPVDLPSNRA